MTDREDYGRESEYVLAAPDSSLITTAQIPEGLPSRRLTAETLRHFGYGLGDFDGQPVQVATYRDTEGRAVAQKLRFPGKRFCMVGNGPGAGLFGEHLCRDKGRMVVITEGEIDCMSVAQAMGLRWPVVSVPSGAKGAEGAVAKSLEFLESYDRVVLMFDSDEPGQEAALACAQVLSPGKAFIARLPEGIKDPNELLVAGDSKAIVDAAWAAKVYRPDGILMGKDLMEAAVAWENVPSVPYTNPDLQAKLGGMRPGEIVVIAAGSGTGKSTLANEISVDLIDAGHKVGVMALEGNLRQNLLRLVGIKANRALHLVDKPFEDDDVQAAFAEIQDGLVMYESAGRLDAESIEGKIRFMARAMGCRFVVLDNLSIVVGSDSSLDERRMIDGLMTRLAGMVKEIGFTLILVAHLKLLPQGKSHEDGGKVSLAHLRGSGMIGKLASDAIGLERDQQDGGTTTIARVLKCRHTGLTGPAGYLSYNQETGRLLRCDPPNAAKAAGFNVEATGDPAKDF